MHNIGKPSKSTKHESARIKSTQRAESEKNNDRAKVTDRQTERETYGENDALLSLCVCLCTKTSRTLTDACASSYTATFGQSSES